MIVRQKQPAPQQIIPNMTQRKLHLRPNLAASGSVVQTQKLLAARVVIEDAMVVFVRSGRKTLCWPQGELLVEAGQAAAVAGGQTFDIVNEPDTQSGVFHAEWIAFDEAVPLQFAEHYGNAAALGNALLLQGFPGLQAAFDYALATLVEPSSPELVVQAALHGVLACLHCGHIALTAVGVFGNAGVGGGPECPPCPPAAPCNRRPSCRSMDGRKGGGAAICQHGHIAPPFGRRGAVVPQLVGRCPHDARADLVAGERLAGGADCRRGGL